MFIRLVCLDPSKYLTLCFANSFIKSNLKNMTELVSNCCGASPYLNEILFERCSDCKENCSFERLEE